MSVPEAMTAAVYRGRRTVVPESVAVPAIGPGELLVRVEACGICHTDLKKIEYDLLPGPRIYGHETAGVVAEVGEGVDSYAVGDRVCFFHHIPCFECHYCRFRDYAQCSTYKRVGVTAGFEPAGGGFAQFVRVMDWIVRRGVERIPPHVSFERATFVEPTNTCLKGLAKLAAVPDESVLVMGQGPIGLLFTALLRRQGVRSIYTTDKVASRLELSRQFGAAEAWDAGGEVLEGVRSVTKDRGADAVIVAASAPGIVEQAVSLSRRGGRVMLFAQTSPTERFELDGKSVCADDRAVFGSYSACADLQSESATTVWDPEFPVDALVTHRFRLDEFESGMRLATRPQEGALKLLVAPQE
ncbi:MAG: alcohol dehydrogenase catalytic domain-containing protein [Bryobacterales bacterium]|nr:alcohol dehydrogenase catalytic domain-containing protein [Bryobacterales bacterium]